MSRPGVAYTSILLLRRPAIACGRLAQRVQANLLLNAES
jgi:hypothetical protein